METKNKTSFSALIRGAWEATIDERPRFYLFALFFVLASILNLLEPWAIGYTLSVFVKYGMTDEAFQKGLLGIAAYTALRLTYTVLHHTARWMQNRVAYSARMNIIMKIFNSLMNFPLRWHVAHHSGESLSRLHRSAGAIDNMIGTYVWQIIECAVKIIFAGIAIFALDFWVAANVLVMAALTIAAMIIFNKALVVRIRRNNSFGDRLNRQLVDYLINIVTVKTLGVEESGKKSVRERKPEGMKISQSISAFMELKWGSTGLGYTLVIGSSLLIYFYGHRQQTTPLDIAQVYVLLNYLNGIFQAIGSFTGYYSGLIEASTAYEDATEIFDYAKSLPVRTEKSTMNESWTSVSIKKLNFSYIPGERVGLNNVRFDFERGEKIALVGQSGSGKSTFLKVFGGLIQPDSYALSTDLQENITLEEMFPQCLLLPQEPEIFSDTVYYNLTMGEEIDPKEISFFASLCKLDTLIARLPNGLESSLAEKGLNLSVGEKQRIALARGLLRAGRKEIILLDEPTSSLDVKNEKEIFLGLLYHFSSRTIFSSVHRLNLVPLFDRIVFMAHSQVVEVGTFNELIERRSHFYRVWEEYERLVKQNPSQGSAATLDMV